MDILPLGLSAFKLKGKKVSVVCDPYDPTMTGLKFPKHTSAAIVTISHTHPDHNNSEIVENPEGGEKVIFAGPGEYEAQGVEVIGIATFHDGKNGAERGSNIVYQITIDGVHIVHCGDLGHTLTDEQAEHIEACDVLLVPVGGVYSLDAKEAAKVVAQIEPSIVVPMHYQQPGLDPKVFGTLAPVSQFLKEMGQENIAAQSKLTITKDKLPAELQVMVLE